MPIEVEIWAQTLHQAKTEDEFANQRILKNQSTQSQQPIRKKFSIFEDDD